MLVTSAQRSLLTDAAGRNTCVNWLSCPSRLCVQAMHSHLEISPCVSLSFAAVLRHALSLTFAHEFSLPLQLAEPIGSYKCIHFCSGKTTSCLSWRRHLTFKPSSRNWDAQRKCSGGSDLNVLGCYFWSVPNIHMLWVTHLKAKHLSQNVTAIASMRSFYLYSGDN